MTLFELVDGLVSRSNSSMDRPKCKFRVIIESGMPPHYLDSPSVSVIAHFLTGGSTSYVTLERNEQRVARVAVKSGEVVSIIVLPDASVDALRAIEAVVPDGVTVK
jgi:hypothetical protein